MYLLIKVGIIGLKIIYMFIKLLPTKNKIVFVSRQSDNPSIDFRLIRDELQKNSNNMELVFVIKKMEKKFKIGFEKF